MRDDIQPASSSLARPSARVAASTSPVQRANYGIPPRRQPVQPTGRPAPAATATSQPSSPRYMDVTAPRPAQPNPAAPIVVTTPTTQPQPYPPVTPELPPQETYTPQQAVTPLFTATPTAQAAPESVIADNRHSWLPRIKLTLLIAGTLLVLGGGGRWITAGSTSGHIIAAGAVSANDGNSMTIQFTATDGQMYKTITKSDPALIPGTGVEVAYRSGAPSNSVKRIAVIKSAQSLGLALVASGALLLSGAGLLVLAARVHRIPHHTATIATSITP